MLPFEDNELFFINLGGAGLTTDLITSKEKHHATRTESERSTFSSTSGR